MDMTGWDRDVLRAFLPALMSWLGAALLLAWREQLQGRAATIELASVLEWSVVVLLLAALAHGGRVSWRLWQARQVDDRRGPESDPGLEARPLGR